MIFQLGTDTVTFSTGGSYPGRRPKNFTQAVDRTAAGTLEVEDLGVNFSRRELFFDALPQSDYDNLEYFIESVVNNSASPFSFTDEKGAVFTVRIVSSIYDLEEIDFEVYAGSILLEVV